MAIVFISYLPSYEMYNLFSAVSQESGEFEDTDEELEFYE